tara:strand:+ start:85 stop:420 length:336 start_codon:yes stop_codon:yes gene_type:complete
MIGFNDSFIYFLNNIDPSPLFVISLIPYLIFLFYASKIKIIPKESYRGFQLTILFVFMTIIFAIIALKFFDDDLTNVDPLHGAAESFLTISDAYILWGFLRIYRNKESKKS